MTNTMTRRNIAYAAALTFILLSAASAGPARAGSQRPAGLLIFPRVTVDTARGADTVVEIANTLRDQPVLVRCFYLSQRGQCSRTGAECSELQPCSKGQSCQPERCDEIDFDFQLTPGQALGWRASQGLQMLPQTPGFPAEGFVPGVPTDPFQGQMECLVLEGELPGPLQPAAGNALIGTATLTARGPDVASYTAVGLESTGNNNGDTLLCLGAKAAGNCQVAEYAPCPDALIANHFFEGALLDEAHVETELSLAACTQQLEIGYGVARVKLLVTNEFEERRCGEVFVGCAGTLSMKNNPLFSVGVQGSLAGQTRLEREAGSTVVAHGVVGVAVERHRRGNKSRSAAYNLQSDGLAPINDMIRLPDFPVP